MNVECISEKKIAGDTVKMTILSLAMQTAAMLFNVALSKKAGTAAVGLMSLIFSLFGFIMVLANGNILTSTSRFISEARGAGHENFSRIMRYSLTFSACLSLGFGTVSFLASGFIGEKLLHSRELVQGVRFISLSLPFASAGSCIKGYFHGTRQVDVPMKGDLLEFAAKWSALFSGLIFFGGTEFFYTVTGMSILIGELMSFVYYAVKYLGEYRRFSKLPVRSAPLLTDTPRSYLKNTFPILLSGYVQMLMSTANELLVPAALLKYSRSAEEALSCYGCFEAMIMPAVFFPSAVLTSLSGIIIPEAALANRVRNEDIRKKRLSALTDGAFLRGFAYAFFVAALFFFGGERAGRLLCAEEPLVSSSLVILAPVVPFIYLEIILEGLLKGMGRQNFSTVNSLFEYAVRIGCVMVFVGRIGFYGVIVSYYASNILSNIARMIVVCKEASLGFDPVKYLLCPMVKGVCCCLLGLGAMKLSRAEYSGDTAALIIYVLSSAAAFALVSPDNKLKISRCPEASGID